MGQSNSGLSSHAMSSGEGGSSERSDDSVLSLCRDMLRGAPPYYHPVGVIGTGTSGVLVRARHVGGDSPVEVVIKMLPRGGLVKSMGIYLKRDIVHTASLKHPLVVSLREVFLSPSHLGIVSDYVAGGNLRTYLNARPGARLPEAEARWLFQQLVIGLEYCHSRGVASRNIKPENLLIDNSNSPLPLLKISDFVYSKHDLNSSGTSSVGDITFMAPDVLLGLSGYDSKAVDAWATGVMLHMMLFGCGPFGDPENPAYTERLLAGEIAPPTNVQVSLDAMHMISRLLQPDPAQRMTMAEATRHPWFLADLPPGALEVNAELLAQVAGEDAARGAALAVAVDQLVEQAVLVGSAEPYVTIEL